MSDDAARLVHLVDQFGRAMEDIDRILADRYARLVDAGMSEETAALLLVDMQRHLLLGRDVAPKDGRT